jgi:hypothetical protein
MYVNRQSSPVIALIKNTDRTSVLSTFGTWSNKLEQRPLGQSSNSSARPIFNPSRVLLMCELPNTDNNERMAPVNLQGQLTGTFQFRPDFEHIASDLMGTAEIPFG